jgi:hypothetical protein
MLVSLVSSAPILLCPRTLDGSLFCLVRYTTMLSVPRLCRRMGRLEMNDNELKRIWKEAVMAYSRYYPGICLETGKNKKSLSQDSRCSARVSNRASPEYKSTALLLDQPVRYLFLNNLFTNAVISSVYSFGFCILLCLLQMKTCMIPRTILSSCFIYIYISKRKQVAC